MGYSHIMPGLAQGSKPETGARLYDDFDTVVLCAQEHQDISLVGVEVIHAPFDDAGDPPSKSEVRIAWNAAKAVAKRVKDGRRVLVTCAAGLNRSGLVNGFALIMLGLRPRQAISVIQMARPGALFNQHFVQLLKSVRSVASESSHAA